MHLERRLVTVCRVSAYDPMKCSSLSMSLTPFPQTAESLTLRLQWLRRVWRSCFIISIRFRPHESTSSRLAHRSLPFFHSLLRMASNTNNPSWQGNDSNTTEDHPLFQSGDFTLISSDNVRFKLPSQQLFMAR